MIISSLFSKNDPGRQKVLFSFLNLNIWGDIPLDGKNENKRKLFSLVHWGLEIDMYDNFRWVGVSVMSAITDLSHSLSPLIPGFPAWYYNMTLILFFMFHSPTDPAPQFR